MRRVQPYTINGFTIRGVDDWLVFVTDAAGAWHYFTTECDRAWNAWARHIGPIDLDLNDPWTDEGVLFVGVEMIRRGEKPYRELDADTIADTEKHFGEPRAYQDGAAFYIDATPASESEPLLIARYPTMVKHDFDMAGAGRARERFQREFPRFTL